jgi:hypothetical protein
MPLWPNTNPAGRFDPGTIEVAGVAADPVLEVAAFTCVV